MTSTAKLRVADAILNPESPVDCTYRNVAAALGLSVGTVYSHFRAIRLDGADLYGLICVVRREQLQARHDRNQVRRRDRGARYFPKKRHIAAVPAGIHALDQDARG